jgi:cell division protein FtsL
MVRIVNALVIVALIVAASWVYKIKFDSTLDAERVSKLRAEIRRERDAVASLRAEWAQLNRPERIQPLAQKHLTLRPVETTQYDALDKLSERPRQLVPPGTSDPIGAIIEIFADSEALTGTLVDPGRR